MLISFDSNLQKEEFVVSCLLWKFETQFDWWYNGCAQCSVKPKPIDTNDPNSPLFCTKCKKIPDRMEPK